MGIRLGRGHLDTGITRYDTAVAVDLLMEATRGTCPQVLERLAADVHHPATVQEYRTRPMTPGGRKVRMLRALPSPELAAWATTFHLQSAVIYDWAARTVESWEQHPEWKAEFRWETPPEATQPTQPIPNWSAHSTEYLDDPLAPVGAMPDTERLNVFKARAVTHWRARVAELRGQGAKVTPAKTSLDHFEWLARYQCGEESMGKIAKSLSSRTHVGVVSEAVKTLATLLELALRPHPKGGRPKKRP